MRNNESYLQQRKTISSEHSTSRIKKMSPLPMYRKRTNIEWACEHAQKECEEKSEEDEKEVTDVEIEKFSVIEEYEEVEVENEEHEKES